MALLVFIFLFINLGCLDGASHLFERSLLPEAIDPLFCFDTSRATVLVICTAIQDLLISYSYNSSNQAEEAICNNTFSPCSLDSHVILLGC